MRVLDRKLRRDLSRLWAQALAIALVMACGVATLILSVGAWRSLEETRSAFYDRYRFGTVFASATRAPRHLKSRIENISGVVSAELRIVKPVLIEVAGMGEPASGLAVSIPELREPAVNRLYLGRGRFPEPGRKNEVAVIEGFAEAHGLRPGDTFEAIMNGRKRTLTIAGTVLSPEYVYAIGPGEIVPDPRRYGVFFMSRAALGGLFDFDGAFNDVSLVTLANVDTRRIVDALDAILEPHGGSGARDREDHFSHAFLDAELGQLKAMAVVMPPIFLLVAAFLVNLILSRLIALEREQIGLLKALGYGNLTIAAHYARLVVAIALVGLLIGSAAGLWLGRELTRLYADFFSFPFLLFRHSLDLHAIGGGVTIAAALGGAAGALRTAVALSPAVAMSPPTPTRYRSFFAGKLQPLGLFSQLTIMAWRHLVRWPVRSLLTTLGMSMPVALLVTSMFSYDSIDSLIDTVFFRAERQDATLIFASNLGPQAVFAAAALPGVLRAEPFRYEAVNLRNGHRRLRVSINGVPGDRDLSRILDLDLNPVPETPRGIMLSERVAERLGLEPGMRVEVELLARNRRIENVTVAALASSYLGLTAYMHIDELGRLMRDGRRISGVKVSLDDGELARLHDGVKKTPAIASIALQSLSLARFRETVERNITTTTAVYVVLAVIIAFGVVYNSARIQLSERARELASLRVLGFTRAEVSSVLMIEVGVMVFLAQPLGWLLGYLMAWAVVQGFASDMFRIPLIVDTETFALSSLVVMGAALGSALIVRRRVDRLDLIRALKTRE